MSSEREVWTSENRRKNVDGFNGMIEVLNSLIVTINNQSQRHSDEIEKIAIKLEENTEVVRKCMTDLVEFNAERSNMIKCVMELREDQKQHAHKINDLQLENTRLNERWNTVRISLATGFTICGLIIALIQVL